MGGKPAFSPRFNMAQGSLELNAAECSRVNQMARVSALTGGAINLTTYHYVF
jgi:hypothetical protein